MRRLATGLGLVMAGLLWIPTTVQAQGGLFGSVGDPFGGASTPTESGSLTSVEIAGAQEGVHGQLVAALHRSYVAVVDGLLGAQQDAQERGLASNPYAREIAMDEAERALRWYAQEIFVAAEGDRGTHDPSRSSLSEPQFRALQMLQGETLADGQKLARGNQLDAASFLVRHWETLDETSLRAFEEIRQGSDQQSERGRDGRRHRASNFGTTGGLTVSTEQLYEAATRTRLEYLQTSMDRPVQLEGLELHMQELIRQGIQEVPMALAEVSLRCVTRAEGLREKLRKRIDEARRTTPRVRLPAGRV